MAIDFKPFDVLFEPVYQLTYISFNGNIDVGPNTYSVFYPYTVQERQVIFQVCQKELPWQFTEEQEQWERTMYMYQFVIKSPPPFPYTEYQLNEDIIMATLLELHQISQESGELFARFEAGMLYKSWAIIEEDVGTANHANRMVLAISTLMHTSDTAKKYYKYFLSNVVIQTHIGNATIPTDAEIVSAITTFYNAMANTEAS